MMDSRGVNSAILLRNNALNVDHVQVEDAAYVVPLASFPTRTISSAQLQVQGHSKRCDCGKDRMLTARYRSAKINIIAMEMS